MNKSTTRKLESADADIPLTGFRRRIRVLRAWRLGAICGIVGAGVASAMAILDMLSIVYFDPVMLVAFTSLGVLVGVSRALTEPLSYEEVAGSVDRRAGLADRVLTAREIAGTQAGWSAAVHDDAASHLADVKPRALYPIRFGRWQIGFIAIALVAPLIWIGANTSLFRNAQQRKDAAELKSAASLVQQVIKPQLEAANTANATAEDKELARELNKFAQSLDKGRMTKPEALIKANQLAEQAQRLEQSRSTASSQSIQKAQTAQEALQKMAGLNSEQMQSMTQSEQRDAMSTQADKLSQQASSIQQQMDAIQRALDNNKSLDGKSALTPKMSEALRKQLAELQKMMENIKLSQKALDFLNKLSKQPDFQKSDAGTRKAGPKPGGTGQG